MIDPIGAEIAIPSRLKLLFLAITFETSSSLPSFLSVS